MSNQVEPGTFGSTAPEPAAFRGHGAVSETAHASAPSAYPAYPDDDPRVTGIYPAFHGRRVSWVAVAIVIVGCVLGGCGLVFGPTWWLFWVGLGLTAVGALLATVTNMFGDWY